jgi:hypothetical protein
MHLFFTVGSMIVFQVGLCLFCYYKKQYEQAEPEMLSNDINLISLQSM